MPVISPSPFGMFGDQVSVYMCSGGPPTTTQDGRYDAADWCIEMAPVAGSSAAYVCISGGSPGIWKAIALGA